MRSRTSTAAAVALAFTLLVPVVGRADPTPATGVDAVSASVFGGAVHVAGAATFVDVRVRVGTDPAGDETGVCPESLVCIPSLPLGDDVTGAFVSRPAPFGDTFQLTLSVGDMPPTVGCPPEVVGYWWEFKVSTSADQWPAYGVYASCTFIWPGTVSTEPTFWLARVVRTGPPQNPIGWGQQTRIDGQISAGEVSFAVPMGAVGALPGATIAAYTRAELQNWGPTPTGIGSQRRTPGQGEGTPQKVDVIDVGPSIVPAPSVQLGIAPEDTPTDQVLLQVEAVISPDGTFTGDLSTTGLPSGHYVLVARACYGEGNCGTATTQVVL